MRLCLVVNPTMKGARAVASRARGLIPVGFDVVLERDTARLLGAKGCELSRADADLVVSVGGDGTFLRSFQRTGLPVLTVNKGDVGFLAVSELTRLRADLVRVLRGDYLVESRMKLAISIGDETIPDAVNEGVIHTAHVAKIRHYRILVDGYRVMDLRADGIIVATPTGSTCYALSVGSPILDPRLEAFVVAPIAPYKLTTRPKVVPASSKITVELLTDEECVLVVDGQSQFPVSGKRIEFTRSASDARFIRFDRDVYRHIRERLPV